MSIESRMDEFTKVSEKGAKEDVRVRMDEFEPVPEHQKFSTKEKNSALPFGFKRFKTCPTCNEFMEIQEVKGHEAIYKCEVCNKEVIAKS